MTLTQILILAGLTGLSAVLARVNYSRGRTWLLLTISLLTLFALQPATAIRYLDFWLPVIALALAGLTWTLTRQPGTSLSRQDLAAALLAAGVALLASLLRYLGPLCCLTPSRPPGILQVLLVVLGVLASGLLLSRLSGRVFRTPTGRPVYWIAWIFIAVLLGIFVVLKSQPLALFASESLRRVSGQDPGLASAGDLGWLGYSYLAYRLVHVLRDIQTGRLAGCSLAEFFTYCFFFPAFTAGPIDRLPRFLTDIHRPQEYLVDDFLGGGQRIFLGLVKKFAIADTLAVIAINPQNAFQIESTGWMWVLLYAYSLRIYFDFSGYTDIALGMGRLVGIQLPENFTAPYLKTNLTAFWNSWHITLAQWFRAYWFNPITRWLRTSHRSIPTWALVLAGQSSTMLLIGLWHGISWNFALWGAWHAAGLFIHSRWADWLKSRSLGHVGGFTAKALSVAGWVVTFHFVTLGWVWFALDKPEASWKVLRVLFGL